MEKADASGPVLAGSVAEAAKDRIEGLAAMRQHIDETDATEEKNWLILISDRGAAVMLDSPRLPESITLTLKTVKLLIGLAMQSDPAVFWNSLAAFNGGLDEMQDGIPEGPYNMVTELISFRDDLGEKEAGRLMGILEKHLGKIEAGSPPSRG